MRRLLTVAALVADAVVGIAVFLPWAGVSGGAATVAGWGSPSTPRLLGLFVLAAAATGLTLRGGALLVGAADRAAPHAWAAVLDGVAIILALTVVAGAGAFVGTTEPASPRAGAWLALLGGVAGLIAGLVSLASAPRRPALPSPTERLSGFGGPPAGG